MPQPFLFKCSIINSFQVVFTIIGLFLVTVAGDPTAEAGGYYHEKRPLLVQPVPEPTPICHVEYDVSVSFNSYIVSFIILQFVQCRW